MARATNFEPDIVVGIDFGMTCTGVAYSMAPEWPAPISILHWPGRLGHENRNKVATAVAYDTNTGHPVSWGFLVDQENDQEDFQVLFKLWLDPSYKSDFQQQPSTTEASKWYRDYLAFLHKAITNHFDEWYPRWTTKKVEFLFSVPTTWKNPAMIAQIEAIINSTGFGLNPKHLARISLTEAECAAVYAAKQPYDKDDVLLICDAGGGTTDVNILKVTSTALNKTALKPLSWVEGKPIGSTLIDYKIKSLILDRLVQIQQFLPEQDLPTLVSRMMSDRFETFKCSFGLAANKSLNLMLPIPGISAKLNFPHLGITDSKVVITQDELKVVFDEQIEDILAFLDSEIRKLQEISPSEIVNYIVLSGGMGGSPYLKQRIKEHFEPNATKLAQAGSIKVISAREPQLAVVHGLVMDRVQELRSSVGVYNEKCCANSYGIVVRRKYNPAIHQGEDVVSDPWDSQKWVERQIDWFIKQGQHVSSIEGINRPYLLKLTDGDQNNPWRATLVMSSLPASRLPKSVREGGVQRLCTLESLIDPKDMKRKNRHWYNVKPSYWRAEVQMKVLIGSADLKFQLWGKNGRISREHDEILVEWDSPSSDGANGVKLNGTKGALMPRG